MFDCDLRGKKIKKGRGSYTAHSEQAVSVIIRRHAGAGLYFLMVIVCCQADFKCHGHKVGHDIICELAPLSEIFRTYL